MRIDLKVPFEDKDMARRMGARWDAGRKTWYLENVKDMRPFIRWMDERLLVPTVNTPKKVLIAKNPRIDAVRYLVKKSRPHQKAHIVKGGDTWCRMKSSGGLGKVRGYETVLDYGDRELCKMCYEAWLRVNADD